jgi:hypothetical protein
MSKLSLAQIKELITQAESGQITSEAVQAFLENPYWFIEKGDGLMVTVDYSKSLAELVSAGNYSRVDSDISKWLATADKVGRTLGTAQFRMRLVRLMRSATHTTDDVLSELDTLALRPATIVELLAFGVHCPTTHLRFPILALGTLMETTRQDGSTVMTVPCLDVDNHSARILDLRWDGRRTSRDGWRCINRFLAVAE